MSDFDPGYPSDFDVRLFADRFLLASKFIASLDEEMQHFLAVVEHADTLGPFLDPTKYRDMLWRKGNMHDLAEVVRLAQPLVAKMNELKETLAA